MVNEKLNEVKDNFAKEEVKINDYKEKNRKEKEHTELTLLLRVYEWWDHHIKILKKDSFQEQMQEKFEEQSINIERMKNEITHKRQLIEEKMQTVNEEVEHTRLNGQNFLAEVNKEISDTLMELDEHKSDLADAKQSLDESKNNLTEMNREFEEKRISLPRLEKEITILDSRIENIKQQIILKQEQIESDNSNQQNAKIDTMINKMQIEKDNHIRDKDKFEGRLRNISESLHTKQQDYDKIIRRIQETKNTNIKQRLEHEMEVLNTKWNQIKDELQNSTVQRRLQALTQQNEQLKTQLNSSWFFNNVLKASEDIIKQTNSFKYFFGRIFQLFKIKDQFRNEHTFHCLEEVSKGSAM